jgi:hypothetical protein
MGYHKVDGFRCHRLGGHKEVPLVLPPFVVHDDYKFAGSEVFNGLFNAG